MTGFGMRKPSLMSIAICTSVLSTVLLMWHMSQYDQYALLDRLRPPPPDGTPQPQESLLVFPESFPHDPASFALDSFTAKEISGLTPVRAKPGENLLSQKKKDYYDYSFSIFNTAKNIQQKLARCANEITLRFQVKVSGPTAFQEDIRPMLLNIVQQIDSKENSYLVLIAELFIDDLKKELVEEDRFYKHWYRFAGSSVWLKEYGVHFMISRVVYTRNLARNSPDLSLIYGQIFDENWKELKYNMVVPSNIKEQSINDFTKIIDTPGKSQKRDKKDDIPYAILKWPGIVPVPFHHVLEDTDRKFFGPEDGHVSLVLNPAGHEEPMIIYNARHLKYYQRSEWKPGSAESKYWSTDHRSMFLVYPFQFQIGKANMDGTVIEKHAKEIYNRGTELVIRGTSRQSKQKNWVPFINYQERQLYGYDKFIYIVYRWSNLEILKCDYHGYCIFEYRLDNDLTIDTAVGDLRGGTQMINLNQLLLESAPPELYKKVQSIIPEGRQAWAGFPRAHIDDCGCGNPFYRPNLAIIIMDTLPEAKGMFHSIYKLSHISSSVGFELPVIGFNLGKPREVCDGPNVLISNGISSWNVPQLKHENGKWVVEDYLTLMLAISDITIHSVDIKGILEQILNAEGPQVYGDTAKPELMGYNDDNLACAMHASTNYCGAYEPNFREMEKNRADYVEAFIEGIMIPGWITAEAQGH